MKTIRLTLGALLLLSLFLFSCKDDDDNNDDFINPSTDPTDAEIIATNFGGNIVLDNLYNYASQEVPDYITKDNSGGNFISDEGATLGRVLFYDKKLSVNNTVSCSSCHLQSHGFSDTAPQSEGVNGFTGRHSMRLINARFASAVRFFWDKRAATLEEQTTMPIQDHIEMGFSGTEGDPDLDSLIHKIQAIDYYNILFKKAYGDSMITESRMQFAIAQFVRSIQSFDSKYDEGLALNNGDVNGPFPNFTMDENRGKAIFMRDPGVPGNGPNGANCHSCHSAPEFDISPGSLNNGVTSSLEGGNDFSVHRAPTLRDLVNNNGELNGPMMHNAGFNDLRSVVEHYNDVPTAPGNAELDPRLVGQQLNLTTQEKDQLVLFLRTLTGNAVYTDPKWADPFVD